MGKQTNRRIKLNNQPKFVSFLNLNSKQTTKQSLIIVSFAYFFSLCYCFAHCSSGFFPSLGAYLCFIFCAHPRGGAINQSTVELCKIQTPEQTNRLSLYIYTIYMRYNYVYRRCGLTHICFENHLPFVCQSECLFALWIKRLDAFCE